MKFTFAPESTPLDGFTIKRAIHRGGFGEVYYALSDAGKEVALKLLNNNLEVELRGVSQCLNLKHPNLVTIFDMKTDGDGDHWIVMEYVSGDCLDKVVAKYPEGMPMEQILRWLSGMTAGISFLHDRGIVHRDLKPANVFSDASGVKIGDVGLSKFISESRRSAQTQSVGTVYYMAPEVARGRYGKEVDVYALGVMLYELVTGNVPFNGETTAEILMKHLSERPDLTPLPERLRPVLARALDKDPERRTPDAKQLELEFCNAVKGIGPAGPPPVPKGLTRPRPEQYAQHAPVVPPQRPNYVQPAVPQPRPVQVPQPTNGPLAWFKSLNPFSKCMVGAILAVFCIQMMDGSMPFAAMFLGFMAYGAHCIWQLLFGKPATPSPAPVAYHNQPQVQQVRRPGQPVPLKPAKPQAAPVFRRAKVVQPRPLSPATVRQVTKRQKLTQLTGSMTVAAICTLVITTLLAVTDVFRNESQVGLFAVVTLAAAWAVMCISKLTEGTGTFGLARRVLLGMTGLVVGGFAGVLNDFLVADVPLGDYGGAYQAGPFANNFGGPTVPLFMLFFAVLFVARRWWWHTDTFRPGRFRISTSLVTVAIACLACLFTNFDFFWGMTWALAVSAVVQLSSAWIPADQRHLAVNQGVKKEAA